ncbi:PREDICTED: mitogen-activated protein kinase kinase kinase kinase 5-like [Nicrophorus vespilloides]|uniref:Mitogen-activated protein kinase kinase kinase kinase 5-like n=1 Tax=Nicrophorus vespilloides TaxID=110193 RepID=A0ABM1MHP3_NICVS|nr:PREDICTED: mitogen-activated protein kinase kinase kinase kinase 5-like [Nicrophorus vespilloides]
MKDRDALERRSARADRRRLSLTYSSKRRDASVDQTSLSSDRCSDVNNSLHSLFLKDANAERTVNMGSNKMKHAIGGSIHRIREFELEKVSLADEFDILQIVGEGWFGKILLVEHKATDTEMVLKALPKPYTALRDFYREFHYGLHLGAHKNIITTYDVAFETAGFYVFSQEYAPLGDLTSNVQETGIGELHTKRVAKQLAAALEHLHTRDLVHRDVKLDNILVFKSDFSRIKLCDFGETRRVGCVVPRRNEWLPYAPPEVLQIQADKDYMTVTSHDVWQFGIVIFVCLTGCLPWQKAACDDPRYTRYLSWHLSTMKIGRQPKLFKLISSKGQRLFKKYLEPRPEKRPAGLAELYRFMDDRWLSKIGIEKNNEVPAEEEGLCPSMYSFHSSPAEKNKLLFSLTQYGLETTVDRAAKKDRIRDWIQNSVIEEEDEDVEDYEDTDDDIRIKDHQTGPAGERIHNRGPITDRRISNGHATIERRISRRNSIRKVPEVYSPPIDPRIPLEQQKDKLIEAKATTKTTTKTMMKQANSLDESDGTSSLYTSNESSASQTTINFDHFGIKNALPFQTIKLQSSVSTESDSSTKHRINIQVPQSQYTIALNGKAPPIAPKRTVREDKRFGAYGNFGSKSSSSNSNNSKK